MKQAPLDPNALTDEQANWSRMDQFIEQYVLPANPTLQATLDYTEQQGYPAHLHVAPNQGALLALLIKISQTKRVLELGTFAGYSTLHMAQALPSDGYLLTIEARPDHFELAQHNIQQAGFDHIVDARLGQVTDILETLPDSTCAFDFIFIDADKRNYPLYLDLCLRHCCSGTLIFLDNVVRQGQVANLEHQKAMLNGLRQLFFDLHHHPRIELATALQTVGCKGHDGFALLRVKS